MKTSASTKPATTDISDRNRLLLPILTVAAVSFLVYLNSLINGFVYDDTFQILGNRWIKDYHYIPDIFSQRVWGFKGGGTSNYYRPLMHVAYMLEYYVFGLKAWGFHLVNILLNTLVSVLVFITTRKLLYGQVRSVKSENLFPPLIAAVLFAVHPIHTEAVTWVASLPELSFTLLYIASFYFYITPGPRNAVLSVAAFLIALFFKETALTLPAVILAYDMAYSRKTLNTTNIIKRYAPYAIAACVYLVPRFIVLGGVAPLMRHQELGAYGYFINIFPLFGWYALKSLLPFNLNVFHVLHPATSIFDANVVLSIMFVAAFAASLVISYRKDKTVFIGLVIFAVPLLPALYIPGVGINTFAERYLYLPSFGLLLAAAAILSRMGVGFRKNPVSVAALCLVAVLFSVGTIARNPVWKDNYVLWVDTVKKSPDGPIPREALGYNLLTMGAVDDAITQYQIALKLDPDFAGAHLNLGIAYDWKGLKEQSIKELEEAVRLAPEMPEAHNALGLEYAVVGQYVKAVGKYQEAIRLNPNFDEAYNNLGVAYRNLGETDLAARQFETAVKLNPDEPSYRKNLESVYGRQ